MRVVAGLVALFAAAGVKAQVPGIAQESDPLALVAPLPALSPLVVRADRPSRVVERARTFLGVPWVFSGRSSKGIDCIGLVFTAMADTYGVKRRDYDRHNHRNAEVAARLGREVLLLRPDALGDDAEMEEGDVLLFLWPLENPVEPPFATNGETQLWVWHAGLYTRGGNVLHAGPWAGKVVEEPLAGFVRAQRFAGVAVVRPARGPARPNRR